MEEYQVAVNRVTVSWIVSTESHSIRLDTFLKHCLPHLSLRELRREIHKENFYINGLLGRKGDRLFGGEAVNFIGYNGLLSQSPLPDFHTQVPVHYEDPHLLVLNKPADMLTHGKSGSQRGTISNFLMAYRPSLRGIGNSRWESGILHRLDQGTSGLILVAKDQPTYDNLRGQFKNKTVQKKYWALVWGKSEKWGKIDCPLTHDLKDRRKMKVDKAIKQRGNKKKRSWKALTEFRRVGFAKGFSLLQVKIKTGVTHQIRVHLQAKGLPIVGDPFYAPGRSNPFSLSRQFLHSYHIGIHHPSTNKIIAFECSLPEDLKSILNHIGFYM